MEGFWNENKNTILLICIGIVLGIVGWYVFCLREDVSDQRDRANAVTEQLNETGKQLQDTATGLQSIQQAINRGTIVNNRTETIIREVQSRTDNDTAILNESSKLITDSKSIISAIRERGAIQTEKSKN